MTSVERRITIGRPLERVWEFIHDPGNGPAWQASVVATSSDGPLALGTRGTEIRSFLGRRFETSAEIVAFEHHRRSAVRVVSGPVPGASTYRFEPVDGGTRLTVVLELEGRALRFAGPLAVRAIRRELDGNLAMLKALLEGGS
ncbi:MAG: SRPBCC family protein [Solirubrobacterales bacterium]